MERTLMTTPERASRQAVSLTQQIARDIRTQIEAGRLRHGASMPSTRELANQWQTSVHTINEAMRLLSAEGLVVSHSRSKRVINYPRQGLDLFQRPTTPQVLLIGGYAGSGKSELARIISRHTGWPMVDKDTITRPVVEAALEMAGRSPHDRESEYYLREVRPREYEALNATILENVQCGNSVVAAAPFLREFKERSWLERTTALFASEEAHTRLVWVYCDAPTMHRYMRQRGAARDASKLAAWPTYLSSIDLDFRPAVEHHVIDNSESSTPLQSQAVELVENILKTD
jgi:DNA-binding transcriptional regulator YhcF (GntR family)/predicted kinase